MQGSRNHYKKFLVDEIMRKCHAKAEDAYREVYCFSRTRDFEDSYKKWLVVQERDSHTRKTAKAIRDVIEGMQ